MPIQMNIAAHHKTAVSIPIGTYDTTVNGATVDLTGGAEGMAIYIHTGTWVDGNHVLSFQHRDGTDPWLEVEHELYIHDMDHNGDYPLTVAGDYKRLLISDGTLDNKLIVIGYTFSAWTEFRVVSTIDSATSGASYSAGMLYVPRNVGIAPGGSQWPELY
jgi:hypothetical protein